MAGRSISGYVDEAVAEQVVALAKAEDRAPASLVGQAVGFYAALPETARNSLSAVQNLGSPDEKTWLMSELVRVLLKADFAVTQRRMADEMRATMPEVATEQDLEDASLEWTESHRR